ncbi:FHA domain-containing protein [Dactylosporangium sp. NPDC050588]|uniref:FHA domain-containing protein n=1 Tax=Dactylosporangium sp. NPDC050588 TaxID=3157211 RepID=UPI0033F59017
MRVERGGQALTLVDEDRLTFGRAKECTICLDPGDAAISRIAGTITREGSVWWLTNASSTRPFAVADEYGFRSVLPPGRRVAVERPVTVLVDGSLAQHDLRLTPPCAPQPAGEPVAEPLTPAVPTEVGAAVVISAADRLAMVALFAGYLREPPHYDPHPRTYAAAAARLDWPRTTLVKRIEYLRARLDEAGVPGMTGHNALVGLAEYALSRELITRDDLRLLR